VGALERERNISCSPQRKWEQRLKMVAPSLSLLVESWGHRVKDNVSEWLRWLEAGRGHPGPSKTWLCNLGSCLTCVGSWEAFSMLFAFCEGGILATINITVLPCLLLYALISLPSVSMHASQPKLSRSHSWIEFESYVTKVMSLS
jgi:hypothetical protein